MFVDPDAVLNRLIQAGDDMFGFQVTAVSLGGINDFGQIAFQASTADGGLGIYVATPVPEPSTLILGLIGPVVVGVKAWCSRGQHQPDRLEEEPDEVFLARFLMRSFAFAFRLTSFIAARDRFFRIS
ncbi:MAG: hypothetical protein RJP95_02610 [Pirellulales bacterium]